MMRYLLAGVAAGAASALYLYFNYQPLMLQGAIHAAIFASGPIAALVAKRRLTAGKAAAYVAGALPVHLAIHFLLIRDIQPLPATMGVSHFLLNLSSLP